MKLLLVLAIASLPAVLAAVLYICALQVARRRRAQQRAAYERSQLLRTEIRIPRNATDAVRGNLTTDPLFVDRSFDAEEIKG